MTTRFNHGVRRERRRKVALHNLLKKQLPKAIATGIDIERVEKEIATLRERGAKL